MVIQFFNTRDPKNCCNLRNPDVHSTFTCHYAEWTFGTIFQRTLDYLGVRMHYGHPDFMDGFWASNRGSTSKASPSLNVSEDMCAGLNLWLRKERSKHSDLLEWEKGREVDFIASSVFFAKISSGASSFLRTRDLFMICENMSLFRQMSFFYGSAGFFLNNAIVDISVMIYVSIFLCLALASVSIADLTLLESPLATEWLLPVGAVTILPQFFELCLEYGPIEGAARLLPRMLPTTIFFVFQNKVVAQSFTNAVLTGFSTYRGTGRPNANKPSTWLQIYRTYANSHFYSALVVLFIYNIQSVMMPGDTSGASTSSSASLPMYMIIFIAAIWLLSPTLFSPQPQPSTVWNNIIEFGSFLVGLPSQKVSRTELKPLQLVGGKGEGEIPERQPGDKNANMFRRLLALVSGTIKKFVSPRTFLVRSAFEAEPKTLYEHWLKISFRDHPWIENFADPGQLGPLILNLFCNLAVFWIVTAMMYAQLLDITVQAFGFFLCVHALLVTIWTATNRSNIIGSLVLLWWLPLPFLIPYIVPHLAPPTVTFAEIQLSGLAFILAMRVVRPASLLASQVALRSVTWFLTSPRCVRLGGGHVDAAVAVRVAKGVYGNVTELVYLLGCEFHVHVYAGVLIFTANLCLQVALMLVEVITGLHSLVFLNPRLAGGWFRAVLRQRDEASNAARMGRAAESAKRGARASVAQI